ncbi:MAG: DapH/DapD/GlmU-related protein, partial [Planctomycetota bacterium]
MSRDATVHPTALVEDDVRIGPGTAIWDGVHVRRGARIGSECILGEKTYVAYDVHIGDRCKLNANVYVCAGVTLEQGVLVAAHVVFTNDRGPRATDPDLRTLRPSEPGAETLRTRVERGASIGANSTIGPGVTLGAWSMVGMGSVVTRDVPPHALVVGNPARRVGTVCRCGEVVARADERGDIPAAPARCACGR